MINKRNPIIREIDMKLSDLTINEYSFKLADKKSTPGGGSALALVLELACDLGIMVCNFTIDKIGYEQFNEEVSSIKDRLQEFKLLAHDLIDKDAEAYQNVMDAFKSKNKDDISKASIFACKVPYSLYVTTQKVEEYCERLYLIGNKNLISDAKIGKDLCKSIYQGCLDNIKCNVNNIEDKKEREFYLDILK